MDEWREWMIQTFSEDKSNFVTAERNADGWNFNRFTCNPFTKEITRLQAERDALLIALHDAIRRPMGVVPASADQFYSPAMADQAEAIRALKSPKPPTC